MKAFCQPRRLLRPVDEAAGFEAALGTTNGSSAHDVLPLSERAANGRADRLEVSNDGSAPLADKGRNGSGAAVVGLGRADIPAGPQWPEKPHSAEALDDHDAGLVHRHSERGSARRH
jgi:hypothetical protein